MQKILFLLLAAMAAPCFAGDLWEINTTTYGPDGTPVTTSEKKCLPKDSANLSHFMGDMEDCTFDQKSGTASAIKFSMTCKMKGMPPELSAMKVAGDAKLDGGHFSMNYTITAVPSKETPGGNFTMKGQAEAHKTGQCTEQ